MCVAPIVILSALIYCFLGKDLFLMYHFEYLLSLCWIYFCTFTLLDDLYVDQGRGSIPRLCFHFQFVRFCLLSLSLLFNHEAPCKEKVCTGIFRCDVLFSSLLPELLLGRSSAPYNI